MFSESSTDPDVLFQLAMNKAFAGKMKESIALHERGFALAAAMDYDREAEARDNYARVLFDAGQYAESRAQLEAAARNYAKRRHRRGLLDVYSRLASPPVDDPEVALDYSDKAIEIARQVEDDEKLALVLANKGQLLLAVNRGDEALAVLGEAVTLSDDSRFTNLLARVRATTGDLEAITDLQSAVEDASREGDAMKEAEALTHLAEAVDAAQRPSEALEHLRKANTIAASLPPDRHTLLIADRLGVALLAAGRLHESVEVLERSVEKSHSLDEPDMESSLLNNLGMAFKEIGNYTAAEQALIRARNIARQEVKEYTEAKTLANMGNLELARGRRQAARDYFLEGRGLAAIVGDKSIEAACLDSIGLTYLNEGDAVGAIKYHKQAVVLHTEIEDWNGLSRDFFNLTSAYVLADEVDNARHTLEEVDALISGQDVNIPASMLAGLRATVAVLAGNWEEARAEFRDSIEVVEMERASFETPAQQRQWAHQRTTVYEQAAEAAMFVGDGKAAFEFLECNKSRFFETISERRRQRPAGLDESTAIRYEQAADRVADIKRRYRIALTQRDYSLRSELDAALAEYECLRTAIEAETLRMEAPKDSFVFPDLEELSETIPPDHAMVSLGIYNRGLGVAGVGRLADGQLWSDAVLDPSFSRSDISNLIYGNNDSIKMVIEDPSCTKDDLGWLIDIEALNDDFNRWQPTIQRTCVVLGEKVWPTIERVLDQRATSVHLMPGAGFNVLPLHAALLPDGTRVGDHYLLRYAPSLRMLNSAYAAPRLAGAPTLGQAVNPSDDLPFASVEATELGKHFAEKHILQKLEATPTAVLKLLSEHDVFHFTGHGAFDTSNPLQSRLVCAPSSDGPGDGLSLRRLLDEAQRTRSRLVVLSACETGRVEAGDIMNDFLNLPGGLLISGARAVMATFWEVDDLATCLLLDECFDRWKQENCELAEAIRDAQLWLREKATVGVIDDRVSGWIARAGHGNEELESIRQELRGFVDRNSLLFSDEIYWAAFHITGVEP